MYQIKNDYNNKKYLSQEYEPVDESAMPYLVDIRAIKVYADSKGVGYCRCVLNPSSLFLLTSFQLTVNI